MGAFVQSKSFQTPGASSYPATLDSNPTAGNLIVVTIHPAGATVTVTGVTDTLGNTYQLADDGTTQAWVDNGVRAQVAVYYAKNITGGGANTVTAALSGSTSGAMTVLEYSGLDPTAPVEAVYGASGASGVPDAGDIAAPAADNAVIVATVSHNGGGNHIADTGFTERHDLGQSGGMYQSQDDVQPTAAARSTQWSAYDSGSGWAAVAVVFKAAGGGGGGATQPPRSMHQFRQRRAA